MFYFCDFNGEIFLKYLLNPLYATTFKISSGFANTRSRWVVSIGRSRIRFQFESIYSSTCSTVVLSVVR
ncbi:hypothetical protein LEP1GSC168_0108 [Leptospira santarosai str. HAI134]|nr:hypothetical protein LEP1GSC168_0108 [Leptospira santarosai str. HAI134]